MRRKNNLLSTEILQPRTQLEKEKNSAIYRLLLIWFLDSHLVYVVQRLKKNERSASGER